MREHFVAITAFFMQAQPPAFAMLEVVANLHIDGCADSGDPPRARLCGNKAFYVFANAVAVDLTCKSSCRIC
jgi:hypothetical protein